MKRVYEFEPNKKAELTKLLEADPYVEGSFARIGYKVKEGGVLGEDKSKNYLYISAGDDFIKKADETLKLLVTIVKGEVEKRILEKIAAEEESAEAGLGSLFG
ncbi:MAG: hypothetical protein Q7S22_06185 [Candidatus Micrarchaeota archaeon]|nr:hypothetical protein [Candidatus Micrarchaeota archaeon]